MKTYPASLLVFIFYSMGNTQAILSLPDQKSGLEKNPQRFDYKLTVESPVQTGDLDNTRAFGIGREVKFIRQEAEVDATRTEVNFLI